jgi:hypothetical protein
MSTYKLNLMYMVCLKCSVNGVRKQKKNRRYKQINLIGLRNNRHPSQHTVGNVHKASGNGRRTAVTRSWIAATSAKRAPFHDTLQAGKQGEVHRTPLIRRLRVSVRCL